MELLRGGHDIGALRKLIQEFTGEMIGFITPGKTAARRTCSPSVPH